MASDNLRQVGRDIRLINRQADLALKRVTNRVPKRERARDTMSSLFPFNMKVDSEGKRDKFLMEINFNKPPPDDCSAECIATACEDFRVINGGHSFSLSNPYEPGTVKVFSQGVPLDPAQWYEENPMGGQVYIQVQTEVELIVICYVYIIC